jgi:type IV secretory pathway VirB3-like protein
LNDRLTHAALPLADTRPTLIFEDLGLGVPLELGCLMIIGGTLINVLAWKFTPIIIPIWWFVARLIRNDYNAPRIRLLWLKGAGLDMAASIWGGASLCPFPRKPEKWFRGIPSA